MNAQATSTFPGSSNITLAIPGLHTLMTGDDDGASLTDLLTLETEFSLWNSNTSTLGMLGFNSELFMNPLFDSFTRIDLLRYLKSVSGSIQRPCSLSPSSLSGTQPSIVVLDSAFISGSPEPDQSALSPEPSPWKEEQAPVRKKKRK